jgi:hypothetical protein
LENAVQKQNTHTPIAADTQTAPGQDLDRSNSLADLAARIRAFHEAAAEGLRRSVENAMAAGDLLIEAKAQLKHGQWLPWLRDHCAMSERTAQLYMRCAKNRAAIEEQAKSATVADLTLNEAAAVLMLSSDVRKLLEMTKTMERLHGEDLIKFCADNDIATISGNIFNAPEPTDQECVEWQLFVLFLAREFGYSVEGATCHVDWVQSRGTLLPDWMKPNPIRDAWMPILQATFDAWNAFLVANRGRSLDDVTAEINRLNEAQIEQLTTRTKPAPRRTVNNRGQRHPTTNAHTNEGTHGFRKIQRH